MESAPRPVKPSFGALREQFALQASAGETLPAHRAELDKMVGIASRCGSAPSTVHAVGGATHVLVNASPTICLARVTLRWALARSAVLRPRDLLGRASVLRAIGHVLDAPQGSE